MPAERQGQATGAADPGSRQRSTRRGAAPGTKRNAVYFPIRPSIVTRTSMRVPLRRRRSLRRPKDIVAAVRLPFGRTSRTVLRTGHDLPRQRTEILAPTGARTLSTRTLTLVG